jgi:hypothetical protein
MPARGRARTVNLSFDIKICAISTYLFCSVS